MIPAPATTWQDEAACAGMPQALFFPEPVDGKLPAFVYEQGRRVCARCPVADQCLRYALDNGETDGLWGGLTPTARRGLVGERTFESRCEREACRQPFTHTFPKARYCSSVCRKAESRERVRSAA